MKNNEFDNTEKMLDSHRPTLSANQKAEMWNRIESSLPVENAKPIPSPFLFSFITTRPMAPIALALVLMLGVGGAGTVAASENAKPGDLLFPIDRAVEDFRLALASDERSAELRAEFARERLLELRQIIDEELAGLEASGEVKISTGTTTTSDSSDDTNTTKVIIEAEADVFSDTTVVKVEINDRKTYFETDADTRAEVVAEIATRFDLLESEVDAVLDFEVENRNSRPSDLGTINLSSSGKVKIDSAVSELLGLLNGVDTDDEDDILSELFEELREIREEGDSNARFRIDDDRDDDSRDDNRSSSSDSSSIIDEAEADVFSDTTTVKVELRNSRDLYFETNADTRAEVVAEIARRTGATEAEVDAVLDFEIEDRASRSNDRNDSDDDDDRDDDSRDDDDRDFDDDSNDRAKVEVRVEDGRAEVRLEYGGERDEFNTLYTTRAALIAQLALRSGLSEATISSALEIEIR